MSGHVLAIDQGTTSTRAIVLRHDFSIAGMAQQAFTQHFPASGWVEHDPADLWQSVLATGRDAIGKAGLTAASISAIGITNQRETVLVWDRVSGETIHPAIVWQDRRTADRCAELKRASCEADVTAKTGLLLDPYFCATKIGWILDHVPRAREQAARGELAFGTVDCYLLFRLTKGRVHRTDATNASRTLLFNIHSQSWDDHLCRLFGVPEAMLPEVMDCAADFAAADAEWFGAPIPILGMAGDQQAALIGQACFKPGMMKSTYGTGCFVHCSTQARITRSPQRQPLADDHCLSTRAARRTYALEGVPSSLPVLPCNGCATGLKRHPNASPEPRRVGRTAPTPRRSRSIWCRPLSASVRRYWDPQAREPRIYRPDAQFRTRRKLPAPRSMSVGYQTRDLIDAIRQDGGLDGELSLRVDGGMSASDWTMQFLADIIPATVECPSVLETTALGAGYLAGWKAGLYPEPESFAGLWSKDRAFRPMMSEDERSSKLAGWRDAVRRTLSTPI